MIINHFEFHYVHLLVVFLVCDSRSRHNYELRDFALHTFNFHPEQRGRKKMLRFHLETWHL